jgi:hypothetical protein
MPLDGFLLFQFNYLNTFVLVKFFTGQIKNDTTKEKIISIE